ncbi:MAG: TonB-dependent receptor [Halioglobus sp.]
MHSQQTAFTPITLAAAVAALLGSSTLPNQAHGKASQMLPEIVVTAEFRKPTLMKSSNSTSVIGEAVLAQRAAQHLEEALNVAPNVHFASGSSRTRYFQIRGVGDRSQFVEPLNPSVGLLIDGVDFSGIGTISTTFDIEQIEILRGPQGTLHGANALAGLINLSTAAPTDTFEHRIEATAGDYSTYSLGAVSSGPITESLLYRVAAQTFRSDGYQENIFLGTDDNAERDETTLRTRLRWLHSSDHTFDLGINYIDIDNGYDAFSLDNTRKTRSDQPGRDAQESLALSLQSDSQLGSVTLQTRFSVAESESTYSYDEDWTFTGFHPDGYSSFDEYQRDRDSVSAELRLLSTEQSALFGQRTQWVAGVYYLANDEMLGRRYNGDNFDSDNDTASLAAFSQFDTAVTDDLTFVVGLRLERRSIDYSDSNGVAFDPDKDLWGGKIALEYDWNDDALLYASISRGYRGNGINAGILSNINDTQSTVNTARLNAVRTFVDETLINYEVGAKGSWLENTLQVRAAVFYMDREDQQVGGSLLIPRGNGATQFIDFTSNAAEGNNYGAEFEIDWLASDALQLWANIGLLETEFEDYINADGRDLSGRDQAHAPNYQYSVGGRYDFTHGIYARLELEGKDTFYFSDRHDEQAGSYDLINASVGIERDSWTLALWGRNLTDEDYTVRGFGSFGNDPRKGYITEPYYQYGEPRMVGVSASYSF